MKSFVAIMCYCQPGYTYQEPNQIVTTSVPVSSGGIVSVQQSQPLTFFQVQLNLNLCLANPFSLFLKHNTYPGGPQYTASVTAAGPVQQFVSTAPQYVAPVQQTAHYQQQHQQQTIVNKEIFIHAAPEETEVIGEQQDIEAGPVHKNYRIVFIKAPAQNIQLNLESLKRAQAANEEKTVIYVLSKKPDLANIQNQLVNVQTEQKAHKPEVYFIKYKTQEEAQRAQKEIQAQYDALGGSTRVTDEGIAPITSVIGGSSAIGGGSSINVGSGAPSFVSSGSIGGGNSVNIGSSYVSSGAVGGGVNYVQSIGGGQQQFVQTVQTTQTTGSGSKLSFPVEVPSSKYLPIIKKK
ncbi:hypothetical protein DOY81_012417 [Sarcophaga bullata]|nr:hypothetical protein DOY81_012417 [Sarcophaga bullata]